GTLLDSHHELPVTNPTHKVIRRIRADHPTLPIVISTGKQYTATASLREQLDLHPFNACHLNGNVIYNPDGSVIMDSGLDIGVVNEVYADMKNRGVSLFLYDYERVHQVLYGANDDHPGIWAQKLRGYGETVLEYTEAESMEIMDKVTKGAIKVIKMAVCQDEEALPATRNVLGNFPSDSFALTQALTFCCELIPSSHNKGTALTALVRHLNEVHALGIEPENVITFGDGENDVSMFKVAGMSVAMGNAMASAKAEAVWETATNDEGGVGLFLEKVFYPNEAQHWAHYA
ncbi:hypothetical protein PUNSTDRAFT_69184, partial [Punctularia strigosozonata HHB-11173 SS5]|uniref:uncharacterized protein n=1 Tax=Punctularia strigosozonata (strain HHB-11173) TaxID=741275 RepID=UPI0004416AE6